MQGRSITFPIEGFRYHRSICYPGCYSFLAVSPTDTVYQELLRLAPAELPPLIACAAAVDQQAAVDTASLAALGACRLEDRGIVPKVPKVLNVPLSDGEGCTHSIPGIVQLMECV